MPEVYPPHETTITRNGVEITVSYPDVKIALDGSETASIKATWVDNLGRTQSERIPMTFPGAAADTLRAQVQNAVDARLAAMFGN